MTETSLPTAVPPEYLRAFDRLAPRPAAELAGLPPRDWLVDGVFPAGEPAVIGGPPKSFKTSIACDLAVSVAAGKPFLNTFPVPRARPVWVISGEVGEHALRDQLGRVAAARGLDLARLPGLVWSTAIPDLDRPEDVAAVAAQVQTRGIQVVVLDPLYLALGGVAGQAANLLAVGPVVHRFAAACRAAGATAVLVHHTIKKPARKARYAELADLTQAGVAEVARAWLLVHKAAGEEDEQKATAEANGAYELTMNVGGSAGHSSRWGLKLDVRDGGWRAAVRGTGPATKGRATKSSRRRGSDSYGLPEGSYGNL